MNAYERIELIRSQLGQKKIDFCNNIGISMQRYNKMSRSKYFQIDVIENLINYNSSYDANWIISGKGSMYREYDQNSHRISMAADVGIPYEVAHYKTKIKALEEKVALLEELLKAYRNQK